MKRDAQTTILQACARFVRRQLDPVLTRLGGIEERALTIDKLQDSVQVRELVAGIVAAHVKSLPVPELPKARDGLDGKSITIDDVAPMLKRLVDEAVAAIPKPKDGEDGKKGDPGKNAEPVLVTDVVAELIRCSDLHPVLDLLAAEAVSKHFEANPLRHGKDGDNASPQMVATAVAEHLQANPIPAAKDGRDGLDLKDLFRADGGRLMAVLSDGTTRDLGVFVGKDGINGKDGLSMADITRTYDGDTHEVVERWTVAGEQKELRYPAGGISPGGFWKEGTVARAAQAFTHDGHLWFAKRETRVKPSIEAKDDWQLAARKGRDGKDGRNGIDKTAPVKVGA